MANSLLVHARRDIVKRSYEFLSKEWKNAKGCLGYLVQFTLEIAILEISKCGDDTLVAVKKTIVSFWEELASYMARVK